MLTQPGSFPSASHDVAILVRKGDQAGAEKVLMEAGVLEPDKSGLAVWVAFGYRVNPQPAKTRQALEQVVQWA